MNTRIIGLSRSSARVRALSADVAFAEFGFVGLFSPR